jgi:NAD(P)-dependent dehydrogenase (short-subunit alcohol dehydrogenase family)
MSEIDRPATVLITGGGAGIGAEAARRFAAQGSSVVILEISPEHAASIARDLPSARIFTLDVADPCAVDAVFAQLKDEGVEIDVLVNNVASNSPESLLHIDPKLMERDLMVTLGVPMRMAQRVLPGMIARRHGVILNVSSVNGLTYLGNEAYSAAKAGLISFTRSLAVQYGPSGIRANAVAPGTIATRAWSRRAAVEPGVLDHLGAWYPLGRVGEPADVAEALVFLASPGAAWISGVCLPVDGGLTAGNLKMTQQMLVDQVQ